MAGNRETNHRDPNRWNNINDAYKHMERFVEKQATTDNWSGYVIEVAGELK